MAVALRNRDRLLPIWPHVHEFLAAILAPSQVKQYCCLVSRMVLPSEKSISCCPGSDISKALQAISAGATSGLCVIALSMAD